MENLTYFILTRKIFESSIWKDDPHILKLFIYLIGTARHKKDPKKYNGFEIKRGELVTSLSLLADDNEFIKNGRLQQWSRAKVSRMLKVLEEQEYIKILSDTYGTHISILKYDTYQSPSTYKTNTSETPLKRLCNDTETVLSINNNGNKENKEKKTKYFSLPDELDKKITPEQWNEWQDYRKEIKKPLTPTAISKQVKFLTEQPNPAECINTAIMNSWQGLFEVRGNGQTLQPEKKYTTEEYRNVFGELAQ